MRRELGDLLLQVWNHGGDPSLPWAGAHWQPRADVYEGPDAVMIQIEVPGLDEEQLRLHFEPTVLTVEGHKARPPLPQGACRCLQMEIQYGSFRRALPLPADADGENIEARYGAGVLTIKVPRRAPQPAHKLTVEIS